MTDYLEPYPDSDALPSILDELSFWSSHFGRLMLRHVPIRSGIRVLDLACGSGFPLFELAHSCGSSCQFIGVDLWQEALHRAVIKNRFYSLKNVLLIRGAGERLPFPDGCFDLVVSNLGVNNFADPQPVFQECSRILKPGGGFALTTNVQGHMREFYDVFRQVLMDLGLTAHLEALAKNELHRKNQTDLSEMLKQSGFQIKKIVEEPFVMRFVNGSSFFRHSLVRIGFLEGWKSVIPAETRQRVFSELEERLNQVAVASGELQMTVPALYIHAIR